MAQITKADVEHWRTQLATAQETLRGRSLPLATRRRITDQVIEAGLTLCSMVEALLNERERALERLEHGERPPEEFVP